MAIGTNNKSIVGGSDTKNPARRRAITPEFTTSRVALGAYTSPPTTPATQPATTRNSHPPRILHPESPASTPSDLIADLLDEPWGYAPTHQSDRGWHTLL
ncbi:MAG TPA: hypothetical protein VL486_13445 [Verrucomicrobiae bacterium]|nr:hypothetical protein [Verrucomicrobiae bacterium]